MIIEVARLGQRLLRDDRVTTHAALVSRAFGASRIYMSGISGDVPETVCEVNRSWGGSFEVVIEEHLKTLVNAKKRDSHCIVHLTMYGQGVGEAVEHIRAWHKILVVVGAGKVPRWIYDLADYNISVGNQPHSEIAALAVFLDRLQDGRQLRRQFEDARMRIVPQRRGKNVLINPQDT